MVLSSNHVCSKIKKVQAKQALTGKSSIGMYRHITSVKLLAWGRLDNSLLKRWTEQRREQIRNKFHERALTETTH